MTSPKKKTPTAEVPPRRPPRPVGKAPDTPKLLAAATPPRPKASTPPSPGAVDRAAWRIRRLAYDDLLGPDRWKEWEAAKRDFRSALSTSSVPGGGRVSKELAAQIKIQDRWLKARLDADRAQKNVAVCLAEARTLLVLKVLAQQHEAYCEAWAGMSAAAKRDADGVRKRLRRAFDEFSREVAKKQGSDALQRSAQIQFPSQCTPIPPDFPFADVIRQWPDTIVAASPATWTDVGLLRAFYLYCRLLAGQSYAIDEQTFHVLDHTEYAEFATEVSYLGVDEVHAHRAFQQACRWYGKQ